MPGNGLGFFDEKVPEQIGRAPEEPGQFALMVGYSNGDDEIVSANVKGSLRQSTIVMPHDT
jgi:hypothetical protein